MYEDRDTAARANGNLLRREPLRACTSDRVSKLSSDRTHRALADGDGTHTTFRLAEAKEVGVAQKRGSIPAERV